MASRDAPADPKGSGLLFTSSLGGAEGAVTLSRLHASQAHLKLFDRPVMILSPRLPIARGVGVRRTANAMGHLRISRARCAGAILPTTSPLIAPAP